MQCIRTKAVSFCTLTRRLEGGVEAIVIGSIVLAVMTTVVEAVTVYLPHFSISGGILGVSRKLWSSLILSSFFCCIAVDPGGTWRENIVAVTSQVFPVT